MEDALSQSTSSIQKSKGKRSAPKEVTHVVNEADDVDFEVKLERTLSLLDGVMVNVGIMIGSGIFISPKGVVAGVESVGATLVVWAATGLISLLGALCYAELGITIDSSGGTYTYIRHIFGDFLGFINFWADIVVVTPASNAVLALLFSTYCLQSFYPDPTCPPTQLAIKLVAVSCVMLTTFVNCWSVRLSSILQNVISIWKLLALALIIITGIVKLTMGSNENFRNPFESTNISGLGMAFYSCFFSYAGWDCLNIIVEELRNPKRNLPIAAMLSLVTVTTVYTLTNVAYFTILSPSELLNSNAVAFTFAAQVFGKFFWIVPVSVVLSCFGSLNGSILTSSRQFFAGARAGHLPHFLTMIGIRHKTPMPCVIMTSLVTCAFCFVDSVLTLINFYGFVKWFFFGLAVAGLLYLRIKESNRPRPFKVHIIFPIIFVLICAIQTTFGVISAPMDSVFAIASMLSGIPIYFMAVRPKTRISWMVDMKKKISISFQKVMLIAPEDSNDA